MVERVDSDSSVQALRERPLAVPLARNSAFGDNSGGRRAHSLDAILPTDRQGFPFLLYSPDLKLLLCQRCQYAVAGNQLRAHITQAHPEQLRQHQNDTADLSKVLPFSTPGAVEFQPYPPNSTLQGSNSTLQGSNSTLQGFRKINRGLLCRPIGNRRPLDLATRSQVESLSLLLFLLPFVYAPVRRRAATNQKSCTMFESYRSPQRPRKYRFVPSLASLGQRLLSQQRSYSYRTWNSSWEGKASPSYGIILPCAFLSVSGASMPWQVITSRLTSPTSTRSGSTMALRRPCNTIGP